MRRAILLATSVLLWTWAAPALAADINLLSPGAMMSSLKLGPAIREIVGTQG